MYVVSTALQLRVKAYFFGFVGGAGAGGGAEGCFDLASSTLVLIVASLVNGELG